jgi:hypothetical protein
MSDRTEENVKSSKAAFEKITQRAEEIQECGDAPDVVAPGEDSVAAPGEGSGFCADSDTAPCSDDPKGQAPVASQSDRKDGS